MDSFITHWREVNQSLSPGNFVEVGRPSAVPGGPAVLVSCANLELMRQNLQSARDAVTTAAQVVSVRREQLKERKAVALVRFNQLAAAVRGRWAQQAYANSLPLAPSIGDGMEGFGEAMHKALALWEMINTDLGGTPLTIDQGQGPFAAYTAANFTSDLSALRSALTLVHEVEESLKLQIEKRNDLQDEIAPVLRDYRQAVVGRFSADHAFVASLPRYSPVAGNKPSAPEVVSAVWNATSNAADVSFTPSASNDVVRHELRIVAGDTYDEDLETIDAVLAVGQPPVFHTSSLLSSPLDVVSYKVYAVNADDQEQSSAAVTLQRPPA